MAPFTPSSGPRGKLFLSWMVKRRTGFSFCFPLFHAPSLSAVFPTY